MVQMNKDLLMSCSVQKWNRLREENPETKSELYFADLSGMRLDGINLSGADIHSTGPICGMRTFAARISIV